MREDYIKIPAEEIGNYLSGDLVDQIFQAINKAVDKTLMSIKRDGVGYTTRPGVPIIGKEPHNLYVEYRTRLASSKEENPVKTHVLLTDIRIFQGWPETIKERMKEVESEIERFKNV